MVLPDDHDCHESRGVRSFLSCGVRIDALDVASAAEAVVTGDARGAVHLCNAYTLSLAARDDRFATMLCDGRLNLPDGMPLVWIARWLGLAKRAERVSGTGLMEAVCAAGVDRGVRHYLFGSTPEVVAGLRAELERRFPGMSIVGAESPPFGEFDGVSLDAAAARFAAVDAEVVWVGLGTPKQDLVVSELATRGDVTFVAVGAAFDFIGGSKPMAPRVMGDHGFEWLYRLSTEPRRLWRRYLVGNSVFVAANLRRRPRALDPAG